MDNCPPLPAFGGIVPGSHSRHTSGSVSLQLDPVEAFVGDLAVNYLPFNISIFPPFAEDTTQLIASWRKILRMWARIILPAHGRPFSVAKFKKDF
jgi:hydroxyacylglutathione hydrolase